MKKLKQFMISVSTIAVVGALFYIDQSDVLNATTFSSTSFSNYEKVKLGDKSFTVISSDSSAIKLLSDNESATNQTWDNAQASLSSYEASFGTLGSNLLSGKSSQPTSTDLAPHMVGTTLNASIPTITSNWWLGDASLDNRSKYMTADNKNDGTNVVKETIMNEDNSCGVEDKTETGALPTIDYVSEKQVKNKVTLEGGVTITNMGGTVSDLEATYYYNNACISNDRTWVTETTTGSYFELLYSKTKNGNIAPWGNANIIPGGYFVNNYLAYDRPTGAAWLPIWDGWQPTEIGEEKSVEIEAGVCYADPTGNSRKLMFLKYGGSIAIAESMMFNKSGTITYRVTGSTLPQGDILAECPGQSNNAGTASIRPMLSLTNDMIAYANNSKRVFSAGNKLTQSFPTSDTGNDKQYLTLKSSQLSVNLDTSANGVTGTKLKTGLSQDKIVKIPVSVTSVKEGTTYVSASAVGKDGNTVYGILGSVTGTTGTVDLDVSNLINDGDKTLSLTLYQEDSGQYDTAYMSEGTPITIEFMDSQTIAFDNGQASSATYGDTFTLTSSLTSDVSKQASSDITYTIDSSNATIISQSYNANTGKATATIKPNTGTGTVSISINKTGSSSVSAASKQTYTVTLNKKAMEVHPTKITKTYLLGQAMPSIVSETTSLVSGDTLPSELVVKYSPIDGTSASKPATGSTIDAVGKWKLTYDSNIITTLPTSFTDKYNITLKDYNDDPSYVFEVLDSNLSDAWVSITPDANANGWNNSDVTIAPSSEAIAKGYTTVVLYDASNAVLKSGTSIVYTMESDGETPIIALRNGSDETGKKTLRSVKIDKTKPMVSSAIDREGEWTKDNKKVTLTTTDTRSGMDSVIVKKGSTNYTVTKENATTYSFMADSNGTYQIEAMDLAGNKTSDSVSVDYIDKTVITVTATLQPFATTDHRTQDIQVSKTVGSAGVKSYKVYYKKNSSDPYEELADLDKTTDPLTFVAKMKGTYKFELIDNTNTTVSDEVEVSEVTPPIPSTKISAVLKDGKSTTYVNNTWVNQDVVLTLSNVNTEITDTVTWQVQEEGSTTWNPVTGNTYEVTSSTWLNKRYSFKATTSTGVEETVETGIRVKIDKEKPSTPTITDESKYTSDALFGEDELVQANKTTKPSSITQTIYYKDGGSGTWKTTVSDAITMKTNGTHELYFKVIDEAGNESDVKGPIHVNLSKEAPSISFTLNKDPMNEWLNTITLGYFFKETVEVEIQVDCEADVYYIVDNSDSPSLPTSADARWVKGTSTKILPDAKAVIYAKAVNKANKETIDSTIYHVYADATNPNIQMPEAYLNWTNDKAFDITVNDALSGIDEKTLKYSSKGVNNAPLALTNGKASLVLVDGDYEVSVQGKDNSGNLANATTRVKVDTVNPTLTSILPDSLDWTTTRIIRFQASDTTSGIATGYPKVKNTKGNVSVVKDGTNLYHFVTDTNDTYTIEVQDQAGNKVSDTYVENKIGTDQSAIRITAQSNGKDVSSRTWINHDLTFSITGGNLGGGVTGYQVAATTGSQPKESDWKAISDPTNQKHVVSTEQKATSYWFRSLPDKATSSTVFVVNLDKTAPTNMAINLTAVNRNVFAYAINALSFGNWMKEAQKVTFSATDNMSSASELTYYYAEEKNGVMGAWKKDSKSLLYQDVDVVLYGKAVDLAGNETMINEPVRIDMKAPLITGVKDQSEYKQYYLPRFVNVSDTGSGILSASYTSGGVTTPISTEAKITGVGNYQVTAEDNAGNSVTISFKIVPFPSLDEIDGSDESKDIIDQIQKELDETRDKLDQTEIDDTQDWINDANDKWNDLRKKVVENEDKTSKVEGIGDTNFDSKVELIVDPIEEDTLPVLPRRAMYSYDVYLKKGTTVVQPNGEIKVYLPYPDDAKPIIYEIDKDGNVREIAATKEGEYVVFTTRNLMKYAISNIEQEVVDPDDKPVNPDNPDNPDEPTNPDDPNKPDDPSKPDNPSNPTDPDDKGEIVVPGPDGKLDNEDDVIAQPSEKGDKPIQNEDGSVTLPNDGSVKYPNGVIIETPEGGILYPDGSLKLPNGLEYDANGKRKPRVCSIKDGVLLNIDIDEDGLPDINLDINDDCKAELNIDLDGDKIPDIDIDSDGDGKADINVDVNEDGTPDLNLMKLSKWTPDKNCNVNGFAYDTMSGLKADDKDSDGDGTPDQSLGNSNDDGTGGATGNKVDGAYTGDNTKWSIWWMVMLTTITTMVYQLYKKRHKKI